MRKFMTALHCPNFMSRGGMVLSPLNDKNKKAKVPALKGAYVQESFFIGADYLSQLVTIKSKEEVIGDIIGLLQSPAQNVISALQSGGNTIHGVLQTLSEK